MERGEGAFGFCSGSGIHSRSESLCGRSSVAASPLCFRLKLGNVRSKFMLAVLRGVESAVVLSWLTFFGSDVCPGRFCPTVCLWATCGPCFVCVADSQSLILLVAQIKIDRALQKLQCVADGVSAAAHLVASAEMGGVLVHAVLRRASSAQTPIPHHQDSEVSEQFQHTFELQSPWSISAIQGTLCIQQLS